MSTIESYLRKGTVTRVYVTKDQWGEIVTTNTTDLKARVEWKRHVVTTAAGDQIVASAKIVLLPGETLNFEDKLRIDGIDHEILSISKPKHFKDVKKIVSIA